MDELMQTGQTHEVDKDPSRLLAVVQPGPYSEQLVEWTHRLASKLNCPWYVVYIDTSRSLNEEDQLYLSRALALARELGGDVVTAAKADFVDGLLWIASQRKITQIIIAKPPRTIFRWFTKGERRLERLLRESGEIDIHLLRFKEHSPAHASLPKVRPYGSSMKEYLMAVGIILAVTWALTFTRGLFNFQAVAWILLTCVVVMAAYVGRGATLLATFLSAVLWDFFFEPPIYSFNIFGFDDQLLFGLYFVIALVLGQLTVRIRRQELAERERQERVEALQVLTRELAGATGFDEMLGLAARRITAVFDFRVAILLPSSVSQLSPHQTSNFQVTEKEMPVAVWAYENGLAAGKYTANFTTSPGLYLPLTGYDTKLGILGLEMIPSAAPGVHQRDLLDAFAEQIALAINRYRISEILEKAKLTSESARLGKTLLNSISHEIRTPLTIIQTATTNALDSDLGGLSDYQRRMLSEIPEATGRLNRLVGKLLDITRLESGHVKPKLELCEVSELVQVAEGETREELSGHKVTIQLAPDLPLVPMDFELLLHSLTNLLSNAAFHTPTGAKHN